MEASMMQQQVRYGFRCTEDVGRAAIVGTTATGVLIWGDPAATHPPTRGPVSDWCSVSTSDAFATTFKFLRKGIYEMHAYVQMALFSTQMQLQMSLDTQFLTPLINTTAAAAGFLDYDFAVTSTDSLAALKVSSTIHITQRLRSTEQYATLSPVGSSRYGTVRIHASETDAGTELQAATIESSSMLLRCDMLAELFG